MWNKHNPFQRQRILAILVVFSLALLFFRGVVAQGKAEVYPQATWTKRTSAAVGLDRKKLDAMRDSIGGRGCVIRHGYLVYGWGDIAKRGDVASACKPWYVHFIFQAVEEGKIAGVNEKVSKWEPRLKNINKKLGYKDREISWRHMANQISCYGLEEKPGTAYCYNDWQMALLWDTLFLKVYGATFENVDQKVLHKKLTTILQCQDKPTFMAFGPKNRPGRVKVSVRDFCRFGLLYLRQGKWKDKQLISAKHVKIATQSSLPNSIPRAGMNPAEMIKGQRSIGSERIPDNQTDHMGSYSFAWWTNGVDRQGKRHWSDVPTDAYGAFGHGGLRAMVVIPSLDLIIAWNDSKVNSREKENRALKQLVDSVNDKAKSSLPGTLRVHPQNPRYFGDGSGKVIYLTGSHTWNNLVDMGLTDPPKSFDFNKYLDWMEKYDHNFMRLWTWEPMTWNTKANRREALLHSGPQPWPRTGPGKAKDGKPKFDLTKFNPKYFERLRNRVSAAQKRQIYTAVMLFEGWAMQFSVGAWERHPLHAANNINGINGDTNKDSKGLEVHELVNSKVTALQEAYVRKVIDTVNGFDNVLYEISNENHPASTKWQYHMIRYIKKYEKTKPKQHPVGMTFQYRDGKNETLFASPADWISPNNKDGYRDNPPAADGVKVIINDTDHLWGIGGNAKWVWKSFLRGHNPIFMDPYDGVVLGKRFDPQWEPIRRAMGYTRWFAKKINLAAMQPKPNLASTKFCLANPGNEYLVYNPKDDLNSVILRLQKGNYKCEWFHPAKGNIIKEGMIRAKGGEQTLPAPFTGSFVLYLKAN
jgi:uncharacterized protein DUF6298